MMPPLVFIQAAVACCRQFSRSWYFGLFPRSVVVPDDAPSINAAINRLGLARAPPKLHAGARGQGHGRGLVLIRPGTYAESVRVTQNCCLLGCGRRGQVVVEAPGWESALVFSGLGVRGFGSGEDACVANVTFRCRNELMRGRCVYIVLGQPLLERCDIQGGVQIAGHHTAPCFHHCRVRASWGSGLHWSDYSHGCLRESLVVQNRRHGVLADHGSRPELVANRVSENAACGIRLFCAAGPAAAPGEGGRREFFGALRARLAGNELKANGGAGLSLTPRFADTEELQVDADDEGERVCLQAASEGFSQGKMNGEDEEPWEGDFTVFAPVGYEDINWPQQ